MPRTASPATGDETLLTIGALSRATGVPVETIRTWERRYRYPAADRKPSGHRLYPLSAVSRLRRAVEAIHRGHRPAEVLRASERQLDRLLAKFEGAPILPALPPETAPAPLAPAPARKRRGGVPAALSAVRAFDSGALRASLEAEWERREPLDFLAEVAGPLLQRIGHEWEARRLDIRHEHFGSAQIAEFLRERRRPFESRASGPWVALATLPGDRHEGGILLASVVFAVAGWRIVYLGADTPVDQIAALAQEARIAAVAVGVSPTARDAAERLRALRELLPRTVSLLVGGAGAQSVPRRAVLLKDLRELREWLDRFTKR